MERIKILWRLRLSETAKSLLWLLENDPSGWVRGSCSIAHPATGVGIWTANSVYGLNVAHHIPTCDARTGHILRGQEQKLGWLDRRALYHACGRGRAPKRGGPIPFAISEWAMKSDKLETV